MLFNLTLPAVFQRKRCCGGKNEPFSAEVYMASVFVPVLPVSVSHRNECLLGEIKRLDPSHITGLT